MMEAHQSDDRTPRNVMRACCTNCVRFGDLHRVIVRAAPKMVTKADKCTQNDAQNEAEFLVVTLVTNRVEPGEHFGDTFFFKKKEICI